MGACCLPDTCLQLTEDLCLKHGDDIQCTTPDEGACCLEGACVMIPEEHCAAEGGDWQGTGVRCEDTKCGGNQHEGACCIDGFCEMVMEMTCAKLGGDWHGAGSSCKGTECGQAPIGACCMDSDCHMHDELLCFEEGGQWYGPNSTCADVDCTTPPEDGAYCVNGGCLMLPSDLRDSVHGMFHGGHCGETECAPFCDGDVNGDGIVDVTDLLAVIAAWGACH